MIFKGLFGKKETAPADVGGTKELLTITRKVAVPKERAFAVFVDELNRWWPREHTWGKTELDAILIEPRYQGRCLERRKDGGTSVWGTVLAFDRPAHIVFAWQISASRTPEESEATSSRVDVRFTETDPGTTDVFVVHRDFFRHGADYEKYRNDMASKKGWPFILDAYVKAVSG